MDFNLTKEEELIRKTARDFAEKKIEPVAVEIDREDRIPEDVYSGMAELEFYGIPFPKKYKGVGSTYTAFAVVVEELSQSLACLGLVLTAHLLSAAAIYYFGTEEQKERYIAPICTGESIGSFAFTEPGTGSDPKQLTSTARLDGSEYVLNGTKRFITNSTLKGHAVIVALDEAGKVCAFIVEKNKEGYSTSKPWDRMGWRGGQVADIYLKDCRIPVANFLGKTGEGYRILLDAIARSKMGISAASVGIGQAALNESIKYAKEKTWRDKTISSFQTIQWLLADMAIRVQAGRWMTYRLAFSMDNEMPDFITQSAMTKTFASEMSVEVTRQAVQVHGSYGYIKGNKVERLYRDAKIGELVEGVNEIQRVIVAGDLLK
jgi:alkylation response protein AidB-like acyl-CoA dehydrogenase